ncbi:hypothetical protein M0805_004486 [Coniferiporia weirii]|nr:hypothetical protein M0805_004486 [Coniferiporia weirii]
MRVEDGFQQTQYEEPNPYTSDLVLPSLLRRYFPQKHEHAAIDADLTRFGERVTNEIRQVSALVGPPALTQYDQWGRRVDRLETSEGWRRLKAIAQEEGIVAIPYERKFGGLSRVYGFAKAIVATGDFQMIFCPLSMTDGAARVIELSGTPEMKRDIFPRLISRDPAVAFTAGQWMTERPGGSDVSQTETTATPVPEDPDRALDSSARGAAYTLDGFKWFSSATDGDVALALARTGPATAGSRSLSLFLVPLRHPLLPASVRTPGSDAPNRRAPSTSNNNIFVHRLKNKIGTHALPTAELSIAGARAQLLSAPGAGVRSIAPVLNITRMHSAAGSVGNLRRALAIARAYAVVRHVPMRTNGDAATKLIPLCDVPLHTAQLARAALVYRALVHLFVGAAALLGRTECGEADAGERLRLRVLTPVVKAFAAELAVAAVEECMCALGGLGYMEETGIGRLIRDGLVERIWEGTATVLSLDLVRATADPLALPAFFEWVRTTTAHAPHTLAAHLSRLEGALVELSLALSPSSAPAPAPVAVAGAVGVTPLVPRAALMLLGHVAAATYLLEHAAWSHAGAGGGESEAEAALDAEVFKRWVDEGGMEGAVSDVRRAREAGAGAGAGALRLRQDSDVAFGVRAKL